MQLNDRYIYILHNQSCRTDFVACYDENRALRRIFGSKTDEVTGGWRELHNEELQNLYSSPSIIRRIKSRRMRWAGHVAQVGNAYRILVGKPEGERPLGRPIRWWVDNIKTNLR
jgi:hypothetical protein